MIGAIGFGVVSAFALITLYSFSLDVRILKMSLKIQDEKVLKNSYLLSLHHEAVVRIVSLGVFRIDERRAFLKFLKEVYKDKDERSNEDEIN